MAVDYKELKKGGFMRQIQKDTVALRIKTIGGQVSLKALEVSQEIAKKYGQGYIHLTSRQAIEIPHIKLADVEAIKQILAEAGLEPGACGPRVRTITACQGNNVCPSALIETSQFAAELDSRFKLRELPHKFKIGMTGCRNNCLKAEENDVGIKGACVPTWIEDKCIYCGLCQVVCPSKSITVNKKEKTLEYNPESCIACGRCVKSCSVDAWEGKSGYLLSFGGTFGNLIAPGKTVLPVLFTKDEVYKAIEAAMEFYKAHGKASERYRLTIDRVGWDALASHLKEALQNE